MSVDLRLPLRLRSVRSLRLVTAYKRLGMSLTTTSRLSFTAFLALSAIMWSDAAFSMLLCPHTTGCHQGAAVSQRHSSPEDTASSDSSEVQSMPCCPVQLSSSAQCGTAPVRCCVLHHGGLGNSAIVSSAQARSKRSQAVLTATIAEDAVTPAHSPLIEHDSSATYVKPVNQKKADLRI